MDTTQDATSQGLAEIAGKLANLGLAPDGDFDIAAETMAALDAQAAEIAGLKRSLAAQRAATTKAGNARDAAKVAAETLAREGRPKARTVPAADKLPQWETKSELLEAIDAATEVTVLALEGRKEILGVPPMAIRGGRKAWRRIGPALVLNVPQLLVKGPGPDQTAHRITGYALMLDGDFAAVGDRAAQLNIGPGMTYNIAGDVTL